MKFSYNDYLRLMLLHAYPYCLLEALCVETLVFLRIVTFIESECD